MLGSEEIKIDPSHSLKLLLCIFYKYKRKIIYGPLLNLTNLCLVKTGFARLRFAYGTAVDASHLNLKASTDFLR